MEQDYLLFYALYAEHCRLEEKLEQPGAKKRRMIKHRARVLQKIEALLCDRDHNFTRWLAGGPCFFISPETGERIRVDLPADGRTAYRFFHFCRKINTGLPISEEEKLHLAFYLSKK